MTVGKQIAICPALPSHMSNICRANFAQSYGQQCPVIWATIAQSYRGNNACKSCRGNNASHTEATLQACVWERKPLFSFTKLLEAFVGTIDIAVYDIHVVGAVCTTYMYSHVRTYVRMYERICVRMYSHWSGLALGVPRSHLPSHSNYKPKVFNCWAAAQTWEQM